MTFCHQLLELASRQMSMLPIYVVFWVGASSVVRVLWGCRLDFGFYGGFGCCECISPCGFSSMG
jgi:hypothetical protein